MHEKLNWLSSSKRPLASGNLLLTCFTLITPESQHNNIVIYPVCREIHRLNTRSSGRYIKAITYIRNHSNGHYFIILKWLLWDEMIVYWSFYTIWVVWHLNRYLIHRGPSSLQMLAISYHKPQNSLRTDSLHGSEPSGNTICIRKLVGLLRICIIGASQNLRPKLFTDGETIPVYLSFMALFKSLLPISQLEFQQIPLDPTCRRRTTHVNSGWPQMAAECISNDAFKCFIFDCTIREFMVHGY